MIPGPMTIFKTKVFDEIGGYDSGNLTEDMEIALRLQRHGYKIRTCFEARAHTDIPSTWKNLYTQRLRWYRGRIFNLLKYKDLFFSGKNVNLGFFALPYLFALELVSIVLLFRLFFLFFDNASKFFVIESMIISSGSFGLYLTELVVSSSIFFFITSYIFVFAFIYLGLKTIRYKPTKSEYIAILLNLLLFPLFITLVYLNSYIKEMRGDEAKWVRVST